MSHETLVFSVCILLLLLSCQQAPEVIQQGVSLYPHDTPFALVLKGGDVLIGGGYESNFGIGQSWGVERYHPDLHSFTPSYTLDRKRAHTSALELDNGDIVISGNWYATDITEIYTDTVEALWTDTASDNRSYPFILPMGNDNAWIIGATYITLIFCLLV